MYETWGDLPRTGVVHLPDTLRNRDVKGKSLSIHLGALLLTT